MEPQPPLHPSDWILHAYGLGKLSGIAVESVVAHLEGCAFVSRPGCRIDRR